MWRRNLRDSWKAMKLMKLYSVTFGMKKEKIFQEKQWEQNENLIKKNGVLNFCREVKFFKVNYWGGCLESLYDILTDSRYEDEKEVCERYGLFPDKEEWIGKILFIETCEEKPLPELFEREVLLLKEKGVFDAVNGVLVGKPQDEAFYQEYKDILIKVIDNEKLPIVYNVNFGHATPRCALQYGVVEKVDMKQKKIFVNK